MSTVNCHGVDCSTTYVRTPDGRVSELTCKKNVIKNSHVYKIYCGIYKKKPDSILHIVILISNAIMNNK